MAHSSEATWDQAAQAVANSAGMTLEALRLAEETYRDMLEVYNYAGATDQGLANLLFQTTTADAAQVAMVTDLRNCIVALHELYQGLNNEAIAQADRDVLLRRMS